MASIFQSIPSKSILSIIFCTSSYLSLSVMYLIYKHTATPEGVSCILAGGHLFCQGCFFKQMVPWWIICSSPSAVSSWTICTDVYNEVFLLTQHLHIHRTKWPSAEKPPSLGSLFLCWERAFPSLFPMGSGKTLWKRLACGNKISTTSLRLICYTQSYISFMKQKSQKDQIGWEL